jgi:hypothetical protein
VQIDLESRSASEWLTLYQPPLRTTLSPIPKTPEV